MKKSKRSIVCIILSAACLAGNLRMTANAKEKWPKGPEIAGEAAIVMEVGTGTVLYEKNAKDRMYPASITKILTALLSIENCKLKDKLTFSYDSVHDTEGSSIWRDVDEVMTVEQTLYALMLNSANECAHAIAEKAGGSLENFIQMMNDRAKALGCKDTHFTNPHGLPEEEHYTTCYDMALIGREAIENRTFRKIISTKKYIIPPTNKHPDENTYLTNHHKMIQPDSPYYYEYCLGGKTGYTVAAGNTLVTFAEKDDMTLVCVVMKEKTPNHYIDTTALLDFCFDKFKLWNISENETGIAGADLSENGAAGDEGFVETNKEDCIVLPATAKFNDAKAKIVFDDAEDNVVGALKYTYAGKTVGSTVIKTTREVADSYHLSLGTSEENNKTSGEKKASSFSLSLVLWIAAGAVVLAGVGFGIYKLRAHPYFLSGGILPGKRMRDRRVIIGKKRGRRRRRR